MPQSIVAWSSPFLPVFSLFILHITPVSSASEVHIQRSGSSDERLSLNKSLLAIQIGSIVGSYVIFVAVLLALLLFVGRKVRRTIRSSNYSLQMEMLKPVRPPVSTDPSPISPMTQNLPSPSKSSAFISWGSIPKGARPSQTSTNGSMVTVDESVVASDRLRAQDEMEMLYAAVLEHDAQKTSGAHVSSVRGSDSQAHSPDSQYTNPFTDRAASQISVVPPPVPPKSPKTASGSRLSKLFSSKSSSNPDAGKLKSPRMPIRKLGISSPLASPDVNAPQSYGHEHPPMSPRFYTPGPPPSAPQAASSVGYVMPPPGRARAPAPAPLSLAMASQPVSSLPFRDAYPLQSAPATKTTILERPEKNHRNGPMTGMPTPYSPYMPFTPVTPFTPGRTVTKRQRRREERGHGLKVLNEDDLVKDDSDMWA